MPRVCSPSDRPGASPCSPTHDRTEEVPIMYEYDVRDALCVGADPELWFPPGEPGSPGYEAMAARGRGICTLCPARRACLELALALGPQAAEGIWGGLDPAQRGALIRAGARAVA